MWQCYALFCIESVQIFTFTFNTASACEQYFKLYYKFWCNLSFSSIIILDLQFNFVYLVLKTWKSTFSKV
jgi:hypothetical protein